MTEYKNCALYNAIENYLEAIDNATSLIAQELHENAYFYMYS